MDRSHYILSCPSTTFSIYFNEAGPLMADVQDLQCAFCLKMSFFYRMNYDYFNFFILYVSRYETPWG